MSNYYNLDGIKTALKKEIARKSAFLAAWEAVTYPTKKDGKPFAVLAKNIDGAKLEAKSYAWRSYERQLTVYAHAPETGYIHESIDCYNIIKYMDATDPRLSKTENYAPHEALLEDVYVYDLNDIKQAVAGRIEQLKKSIAASNMQLAQIDKIYSAFVSAYGAAVEGLKIACKNCSDPGYSDGKNFTYYAILETVKNRYPYC